MSTPARTARKGAPRLRLCRVQTPKSGADTSYRLIDLPSHAFPDVPFASLLTYSFRRFGYPNAGWDDYKDLARWQLEAFGGRLLLRIEPTLSNSRQFLLYAHRADCEVLEAFEESGWQAWRAGRDALVKDSQRSEADVRNATARYSELHPHPQSWRGASDLTQWDQADPMLPFVMDARAIAKDLERFVRVRDQAFNAYGTVGGVSNRVIHEAKSAGFPSGALGNIEPRAMARVHQAISRLGHGNPAKGLPRAAALLEAAVA